MGVGGVYVVRWLGVCVIHDLGGMSELFLEK
jgi:hypothetical protein